MFEKYSKFIDELLAKMTLREKIGQLNQPETPTAENAEQVKEQVRRGEIGSILMSVGATAGNTAQGSISVDFYNELQRIAVEESRCGIPLIFGRDVIHGHRTVCPVPLAQAAAFDPELVETCCRDIAEEAANESIHWTFTPMLDLCHDPRWGRIIEGCGEDPYVGRRMAQAVVRGFQGEDVSAPDSLLACAKHYIGYGAAEGGRDYHHAEISDYNLYNNYLPAFHAAVEAGAMTVMSSFNDVNGQPVTSSRYYLTDVLRGKLGFEGFVVSDYSAVNQLVKQGTAQNDKEAASMAITAGIDMDMWDYCYLDNLEQAAADGLVDTDVIDTAVRRVLQVKLAKGLFDHPYCTPKTIDRSEHLKNARRLARESMVLLKNENGLLPLDKSDSIALLGPFVHERRSLLGSWTIDGKAEETPTLYEAMKAAGVSPLISSDPSGLYDDNPFIMESAQVLVLALGESWLTTGENHSSSEITISAAQKRLIADAKASGKKTVGVFFCGRPIAMEGIADQLDAVLYAWHGGSETAGAVCDLLFGEYSPGGRLPVTMPRRSTHIPLYYNCLPSGRPVNGYYGEFPESNYTDSIALPCYPFGYGLSYTTFDYSAIGCKNDRLTLGELEKGDGFELSVDVTNSGGFDSYETVQLYIRDVCARMMRPLRELKGFEKVFIRQGERKTVTFKPGKAELGYFMPDGSFALEKGRFEIYIGENCLTKNKTEIEII